MARSWRNRLIISLTEKELDRFKSKFGSPNENGCMVWQGSVSDNGYGVFWLRRKSEGAHRISVMVSGRQIPAGMQVDHLCRKPKCVNPLHLEVVTPRENQRRGIGFSAVNAVKTQCPKGHPLEDGNLDAYAMKKGRRACQECMRARCRAWHHKNREARLQKMRAYKANRKTEDTYASRSANV